MTSITTTKAVVAASTTSAAAQATSTMTVAASIVSKKKVLTKRSGTMRQEGKDQIWKMFTKENNFILFE